MNVQRACRSRSRPSTRTADPAALVAERIDDLGAPEQIGPHLLLATYGLSADDLEPLRPPPNRPPAGVAASDRHRTHRTNPAMNLRPQTPPPLNRPPGADRRPGFSATRTVAEPPSRSAAPAATERAGHDRPDHDRQTRHQPRQRTEYWLTVQECLAELGVPRSTWEKWRQRDVAPPTKRLPNGQLRVRRVWFEEWIANLPERR